MESFDISSTENFLFVKFDPHHSDIYSNNDLGFLANIHYGNPYLNVK